MKNMYCKIIGHELIELDNDSILIKEFKCKKCLQKFTIDGYGKIVKLTPYWEQNNFVFKNSKSYNY